MIKQALRLFITVLVVVGVGSFALDQLAGTASSQQSQPSTKSPLNAGDNRSPLLESLYQAARQEHSKDSLRYLDQAQQLLKQNAAVKTKDAQGRTPLHWTVIGAMYAHEEKHQQAYLELADLLIGRGAEVNAEDSYGNTPLDFQQVSPNEAIHYLLLDHNARNGDGRDETERLKGFINKIATASRAGDLSKLRAELSADLPVGTEINIRLTTKVGSKSSWSGDPVEAVVIAPVVVGDRVAVGPGTKLRGTVLLALKARDDYDRAQLILDFPALVHPRGAQTRIVTRLAEVENAKETVQAGRIIGLPHPNESKFTWGARLIGLANPVLAYAIQAAVFVRDKEYKREINYEPGVEMRLTVLAPAKLAEMSGGQPWPVLPASAPLIELIRAQPLQTTTANKTPSDLTNLAFIGTREKIAAAFQAAGWEEPEALGAKSGLKTFLAVAENKGYRSAPVSLLVLDGQKPDLAFQKQNDTFAKRHHIRLWKRPHSHQGQEVWVAAGTHDIGIAVHREGTQWIHQIDSKIDRERAKVANDLLFTGLVKGHVLIDRPAAPRAGMNATGDKLETDGRMMILFLK